MTNDAYSIWCFLRGCTHGHCPDHCEHPQPILLATGQFVCGRCLIRFGEISEMIACTPDNC
jgi:hypothetical protein